MRTVHNTDKAPAPVGPYNQAISFNGVLYCSGQIAIDTATGKLVTDDIEAETRQVMQNIAEVLHNAGTDFDKVLKCTVFVSNMDHYDRINAVYTQYFDEDTAPARELVEVARLPKYANVEISVLAAL